MTTITAEGIMGMATNMGTEGIQGIISSFLVATLADIMANLTMETTMETIIITTTTDTPMAKKKI